MSVHKVSHMHSFFSYLHSKVVVTDVLNYYVFTHSWPHQISDFSIVVIVTVTYSSWIHFFAENMIFMKY